MQYKRLGRSGLFLSELTLGTMLFGDQRKKGTSESDSLRILDRYLDAGGNHIDTANIYVGGESERIVGKALKGRRDKIVLATKCNFPLQDGPNEKGLSRFSIMKEVEASLERLDTDYIDLYYMHAQDSQTPVEESLRAFDDLVRQGKVRYIGVSNFFAGRLAKAMALSEFRGWERFVAAQYQYSLVVRDIEYELTTLFEEEKIGLMPWGPLGGGFLSGKYKKGEQPKEGRIADHPDHTEEAWHRRNRERNWNILEEIEEIASEWDASYPQIALAWLLHQPVVCSPIIGTRTMAQLEDNLKAIDIQLSEDQLSRLDEASQLPEIYPYRFISVYAR